MHSQMRRAPPSSFASNAITPKACRRLVVSVRPAWEASARGRFPYLALALGRPSEAQQVFVLPRHKVDGGVLQERREDEKKTHRHPDVYGLDVGDL